MRVVHEAIRQEGEHERRRQRGAACRASATGPAGTSPRRQRESRQQQQVVGEHLVHAEPDEAARPSATARASRPRTPARAAPGRRCSRRRDAAGRAAAGGRPTTAARWKAADRRCRADAAIEHPHLRIRHDDRQHPVERDDADRPERGTGPLRSVARGHDPRREHVVARKLPLQARDAMGESNQALVQRRPGHENVTDHDQADGPCKWTPGRTERQAQAGPANDEPTVDRHGDEDEQQEHRQDVDDSERDAMHRSPFDRHAPAPPLSIAAGLGPRCCASTHPLDTFVTGALCQAGNLLD